jgi:hypothetical protein
MLGVERFEERAVHTKLAAKDGCFDMQTWAVEATEKNLESSEEFLNIALDVPGTRCMQMAGNN